MYVGRFVVVAPEIAAYRVSSRSFPNREIEARNGALAVGPTPDAPDTDNPYVAYTCVRTGDEHAVVGNGSHVDPISEKLDRGYPPRDALASVLLAMDYETDDYDTPRLAGAIDGDAAHVGIVRRDALLVSEVAEPTLVATYEKDAPEPVAFDPETAEEAASAVLGMDFEHPVCAAAVRRAGDGWELGVDNGPS